MEMTLRKSNSKRTLVAGNGKKHWKWGGKWPKNMVFLSKFTPLHRHSHPLYCTFFTQKSMFLAHFSPNFLLRSLRSNLAKNNELSRRARKITERTRKKKRRKSENFKQRQQRKEVILLYNHQVHMLMHPFSEKTGISHLNLFLIAPCF